MNNLILNRCAIWQPKTIDELTVREYPVGRVYFKNNIARTSDVCLYRYAKNYSITTSSGDVKFCLFVVTKTDSKVDVENYLDGVANSLDPGVAQKAVMMSDNASFKYLDNYYGEELGDGDEFAE